MPILMMLEDTVECLGEWMLFCVIVLGYYGFLMLLALFAGVAIRTAWRWLRRWTWNDMLVLSERKIFR